MPSKTPPYQLVPGDRFNITLGVCLMAALATLKDAKFLSEFARMQVRQYTNWNIAFLVVGVLLRQQQWHPFLLVNSMGVLCGVRTAFAQGLDENMRKKLNSRGLDLSRPAFLAADHLLHSVPAALLLYSVVSRRQRIHPMNSVYALSLATWFSFRQSAKLDASDLYIPHPWKRAWVAIFTGAILTPPLVDALVSRKHGKAAICVLALFAPWLSAKLDPNLKQKYMFEAAHKRVVETLEARKEAHALEHKANGTMRISQSELILGHKLRTPENGT